MAGSIPDQLNFGSFVPTTYIWDVAQLQQIDVNSQQFKELLVRLYQNINNIAISLNTRDAGYYVLQEFVNGQIFFPDPTLVAATVTPVLRQVFRFVVNFGALPNAGTKSVAHGLTITTDFTFTRIYGCASDTTNRVFLPLPYASPTDANNIELFVDATNVTVITGSDRTAFDTTYIILEYLKQ